MYPGGPPKPPYDVTGHTLGLLMGVDVDQVDQKFDAQLEPAKTLKRDPAFSTSRSVYLMDPGSNAPFMAVAKLQAANVTVARTRRHTNPATGTSHVHNTS